MSNECFLLLQAEMAKNNQNGVEGEIDEGLYSRQLYVYKCLSQLIVIKFGCF